MITPNLPLFFLLMLPKTRKFDFCSGFGAK